MPFLSLQVLTGHSDDVTCVVVTSRGRFVVTGSVDGTAQVWDLAAHDVSSTDVHEGKVRGQQSCYVTNCVIFKCYTRYLGVCGCDVFVLAKGYGMMIVILGG